ncbi:unnamed protein product [Lampetra planeri]
MGWSLSAIQGAQPLDEEPAVIGRKFPHVVASPRAARTVQIASVPVGGNSLPRPSGTLLPPDVRKRTGSYALLKHRHHLIATALGVYFVPPSPPHLRSARLAPHGGAMRTSALLTRRRVSKPAQEPCSRRDRHLPLK